MHPREVARAIGRVQADEVGVDVEVGVGDEAEVLVFAPVKVEHDAVAADDLRVAAQSSLLMAVRCTIKQPGHVQITLGNYQLYLKAVDISMTLMIRLVIKGDNFVHY